MQAVRTFHTGGVIQFSDYRELTSQDALLLPEGAHRTLSLVPTQLKRLIEDAHALRCLRQFDSIFIGGASVNKSLLSKALEAQLSLVLTYGMTETAAMVALRPVTDLVIENEPVAGQLLPGVDVPPKN